MGGDHAPAEVVHGAIEAIRSGVEVILVGDRARIQPLLEAAGCSARVVHASETIGMGDDPSIAIREKKDSSVSVAARLVATGDAAGFVSAGSTGAAMAAAALIVGRLPEVRRPAIASIFPTRKIVVDSGANLDVRPEHLVQFAVMGSALAETYLQITDPKVGLLNIGEEDGKGRDLEKEAFKLLSTAPVNFVGNVEGRDVAGDRVDVIVTDGFSGNVLLKGAEGSGRMLLEMMMEQAASDPGLRAMLPTLAPAFRQLRSRVDPETYGGAHLVGTRGVVVIAHGSSTRVAIANALRMAAADAANGLVERIAAGIGATVA
jgi:glycerol-3-phosphate acyltransferase PlsX